MNVWGWVFMVTSVSFVTVLIVWCYMRVFSSGGDDGEVSSVENYAVRGVRWESRRQQALDHAPEPEPEEPEDR